MTTLERGLCNNCGAEDARRWTMLGGREVCDECWLDVSNDVNARSLAQAAASAKVSCVPATRTPLTLGSRLNPRSVSNPPHRELGSAAAQDRRGSPSVALTETTHAYCLLCGRIWWDAERTRCKTCGGLCVQRGTRDLSLMQRSAARCVEEAEK